MQLLHESKKEIMKSIYRKVNIPFDGYPGDLLKIKGEVENKPLY